MDCNLLNKQAKFGAKIVTRCWKMAVLCWHIAAPDILLGMGPYCLDPRPVSTNFVRYGHGADVEGFEAKHV